MLPYFTSTREVAEFVDLLAGRASCLLLLETAAAVERLPEIVKVPGIDEIAVGLNDLRLSAGFVNIFDVVVSGLMETISRRIHDAGIRFGFGGLARYDDATLAVPPDLVYAQYPTLGANSAWLARSFYTGLPPTGIGAAVRALRDRMDYWSTQPASVLEDRRRTLATVLAGSQVRSV